MDAARRLTLPNNTFEQIVGVEQTGRPARAFASAVEEHSASKDQDPMVQSAVSAVVTRSRDGRNTHIALMTTAIPSKLIVMSIIP